jgi:polyisoprenoid-binding protein YceI
MKKAICLCLILACCLVSLEVRAKAPEWSLDKAHSGIYFDIRHIYSTVRGQFQEYSADFHFDAEDLAGSSFAFVVQAESIDTGIRNRDNHLRSADFFDVSAFPELSFQSTEIVHVQGQEYLAKGRLTIKDVSRNMSVPFTFFGVTTSPLQKKVQVAGFEASLDLDRLEYTVGTGKFFEMGVLDRKVRILISLEMQRPGQ